MGTIFTIILVISLLLNVLLSIYFLKSYKLLQDYEDILIDFREKIENAFMQLESIDHKEYFEEHDSVGLAFKVIKRIYHDLKNFLQQ